MKSVKRLKKFAYLLGVNKVVEAENFEDGVAGSQYLFPQKIITLYAKLPESEKLLTLAHELGHFMNRSRYETEVMLAEEALTLMRAHPKTKILMKYYNDGLCKDVTVSAHQAVLAEEVLAWKQAEEMLVFLGIKLPKNFKKEKNKALNSYRKSLKKSLKYKKTKRFTIDEELEGPKS